MAVRHALPNGKDYPQMKKMLFRHALQIHMPCNMNVCDLSCVAVSVFLLRKFSCPKKREILTCTLPCFHAIIPTMFSLGACANTNAPTPIIDGMHYTLFSMKQPLQLQFASWIENIVHTSFMRGSHFATSNHCKIWCDFFVTCRLQTPARTPPLKRAMAG